MEGLDDGGLAELEERGWTRIPGFVDETAMADARERIWLHLRDRGIDPADRATWPTTITKLKPLTTAGVFDAFLGPGLDGLSDRLLGPGRWTDLGTGPQALLSFPTAGPWVVPHKVWHFDLPARGGTDGPIAMRFLGFVSDVAHQGGGTLVVEGSHRLTRRLVDATVDGDFGASADVRRALDAHPWFRELARPSAGVDRVSFFMDAPTDVDGVPCRVAELTGRPGDLVVMHPWLMHNIAMNCADRPRMMMSLTRYRT